MQVERPVDRGYPGCGSGDGENPDALAQGEVPDHQVVRGDPGGPGEAAVLLLRGARPPTTFDEVDGVQLRVLRYAPFPLQFAASLQPVVEQIAPALLRDQQARERTALVRAGIIDVAGVHERNIWPLAALRENESVTRPRGGPVPAPHPTRVAPANGISLIGATRTGAFGFGAWIIWPLPMYRPTWLMEE